MTIMLLCLVKENALANAFPVHIDGNSLVGDLKKVIKAKKQNDFAVEPPASTATSDEVLELREKLTSLQGLNKYTYEFDIVVSPKRKSYKQMVNIEHASLEDPKTSIRDTYQLPALENDGTVLNFINDSPRNDDASREMLRSLVFKNSLKFTVLIETPSKPFNKWSRVLNGSGQVR
ncbi:unnamed protein product [Rhizophagus irregularis]|nr:unnamed protein product [Rhizophagus irregularis]